MSRVAFVGLLALIFWAPWPLGSNRPWAVATLAGLAWMLVAIAALAATLGAEQGQRSWLTPLARLPLAGLLLFALLVLAQWQAGLSGMAGLVSIDPAHTRRYLLTTLVYVGAWLLVGLTVNTAQRADRVLAALVGAGVAQAIAAVLLYSANVRIEFLHTMLETGRATGTFVNPDHFSAYMELGLSAGLGWLLARLGGPGGERNPRWQARVVGVMAFVLSPKMLLRLLLVVMVIALVLSRSRAGNGGFFVSIFIVGIIIAVASRQLRRPALWLVASMALIDLLVIGQWVGLERVAERMGNTDVVKAEAPPTVFGATTPPTIFGANAPPPAPREESLRERLEVPRLSLRLVADRPWFGHGGGTYVTAFAPFKTAGVSPLHWDHAHNDYVQVACDTGWVGLALWLTAGVATLARALYLLGDARPRATRGPAIAALTAIVCMGLHSMVDFNLHITANALTFTVLLALVWAVPATTTRRGRREVS